MRVRVLVVLPLLLLLAVETALAQQREFGAKAGPSFARLIDTAGPSDVYSRRLAIAGGVFATFPVGGRLALQVEALQMPKGTKLNTGSSVGTNKLLLDYLDIPVLARVAAPGSLGFHVFGGPYVGFRLRAKLEYAETVSSFTAGSRQDVSNDVERTEFGVVAGAGLHLGRHGVIDGRYAWGLTNLNRNTTEGVRLRNRVAGIMAGVRF
jgi:hypothetical protein